MIEKYEYQGIKIELDGARIPGENVVTARFGRQHYCDSFPKEMRYEQMMRLVKKGLKMLFWDD